MRPALIVMSLALLAACATPREQCISNVTRDARVQSSLINEVRGNLERGYALDRRQDVRTIRRTCSARNDAGDVFRYRCDRTRTFTTVVPVAIDLEAERAKLASLEARFAQSQATADQAIAQCIAVHPE